VSKKKKEISEDAGPAAHTTTNNVVQLLPMRLCDEKMMIIICR
jgi:hypothetical protein